MRALTVMKAAKPSKPAPKATEKVCDLLNEKLAYIMRHVV